MKYVVSELEGELLDAAVAKALDVPNVELYQNRSWCSVERSKDGRTTIPILVDSYSSLWEHGGPLIEKAKITIFHDAWWEAGLNAELSCSYGAPSLELSFKSRGSTALIAAMRAFECPSLARRWSCDA